MSPVASGVASAPRVAPGIAVIPFTALSEIERAARRAVDAIDFDGIAKKVVQEGWYKAAGRV